MLRGKLQIDIVQRRKTLVQPPQPLHLLRQLVGQYLQMLAIKIERRRGCRECLLAERFGHGAQHRFRLGWLGEDARDPTVLRELLRLGSVVVRRKEDDRRRGKRGVCAQLANEFVAVHRRHQYLRNHEVRMLEARDGERLRPAARLEQAVTVIAEQRHQVFPVLDAIVDDQNLGHCSPVIGPSAGAQGIGPGARARAHRRS